MFSREFLGWKMVGGTGRRTDLVRSLLLSMVWTVFNAVGWIAGFAGRVLKELR